MDLQVNRATVNELAAAFQIAEEYFAQLDVVVREDRAALQREYFVEGAGFWLALADGQIVGCIALRRLSHTAGEIKRMYVRESWRGHGIAPALLEAAERFARASGYDWLYLDTTDGMKAAARLYERHGYSRCDRYNDNPQATIFMKKQLLPVQATI